MPTPRVYGLSTTTEAITLSLKLTAESGAPAGVKIEMPITTRQVETTENHDEFTDEDDSNHWITTRIPSI